MPDYLMCAAVFLLVVQCTHELGNWTKFRRPKYMGDDISLKSLNPRRHKVQQKIAIYHNFFRSKVEPSATNMLKMRWHMGAANAAQRWADECLFLVHDNATGRYIENYQECGQNIFIATHKVPWFFAIETWWLEKEDFTFGKPNNLSVIGHYTQMVWGATHEVGCGIAQCYHHGNYKYTKAKMFYNYVCNYCPIGNRPGRLGTPYRRGKPCGLCKNRCQGKLCLNSCKTADRWSNCRKLYRAHPYWLCHSKTPQGTDRFNHCKATCTCKRRIHD